MQCCVYSLAFCSNWSIGWFGDFTTANSNRWLDRPTDHSHSIRRLIARELSIGESAFQFTARTEDLPHIVLSKSADYLDCVIVNSLCTYAFRVILVWYLCDSRSHWWSDRVDSCPSTVAIEPIGRKSQSFSDHSPVSGRFALRCIVTGFSWLSSALSAAWLPTQSFQMILLFTSCAARLMI